jgi:hypothetical protein
MNVGWYWAENVLGQIADMADAAQFIQIWGPKFYPAAAR